MPTPSSQPALATELRKGAILQKVVDGKTDEVLAMLRDFGFAMRWMERFGVEFHHCFLGDEALDASRLASLPYGRDMRVTVETYRAFPISRRQ